MKLPFFKSSNFIRSRIVLVLLLLVVFRSNIYAQSLMENLGGVNTNFEFSSDSVELTIIDQAIIQRGFYAFNFDKDKSVSNSNANAYGYGYGYGYGLQTFHLEFITTSEIKQVIAYETKPVEAKYSIKLYDDKNILLVNFEVLYRDSKATPQTSGISSYSINLNRIPIILFNKTKRIDITIILM